MAKHAQSIEKDILTRIQKHGRGWVFTSSDFLDCGGRGTVLSALLRLKRNGLIRQLARGLYDLPKSDPKLGTLAPAADAVADALARRDSVRVQPSGAYAANMLRLSEQVPMKVVFLTDGPSRKVMLGRQEIALKHTTPRNMAPAGRVSGLVIQALRHLGKGRVSDDVVVQLSKQLDQESRNQVRADIPYAPAWIAAILRRLGRQPKVQE
jgi:hypothetical protein